jgi:5-dehydro-2-deoxygluconokinase
MMKASNEMKGELTCVTFSHDKSGLASSYDVICLGRSSMDLFSLDIGAPFEEITRFATSVGGSPSNIAIGTSRLGLSVALLTAVGEDAVGRLVLHRLVSEGVETECIVVKPGTRTSLAVVGVEPPDTFPLLFYRENPADVELTFEDLRSVPFGRCRALVLTGTGLSRSPRREITLAAAEIAARQGATVFLDLDIRPDQWHDPSAYSVNLRRLLPLVDIAIGTEEELYAALVSNRNPSQSTAIKSLDGTERDELDEHVRSWLELHSKPGVVVIKRGARGVTVRTRAVEEHLPAFEVKPVNTVGAGDAFASGLIYGHLSGWGWRESARFGAACGALVVTRHGCSEALPTTAEVRAFIAAQPEGDPGSID